ncbi:MAG: DUF1905 domain-containing protein [Rhodothermia bacterium]|nr:DUF1905 domain-containing protein [Rhodothermia bacterium]
MHTFTAELIRPDDPGTWTFIVMPFNVEETYGVRSQFKVRGTINEVEFAGTLMPRGDGTHFLVVKQALREKIGKEKGDTVAVFLEPDTGTREVTIPSDVELALKLKPEALTTFNALSYSHKKEYIDWIESAKRAKTRQNRILKMLEKLELTEN